MCETDIERNFKDCECIMDNYHIISVTKCLTTWMCILYTD